MKKKSKGVKKKSKGVDISKGWYDRNENWELLSKIREPIESPLIKKMEKVKLILSVIEDNLLSLKRADLSRTGIATYGFPEFGTEIEVKIINESELNIHIKYDSNS
jgi:hypothetical protein